MSRPLRIQEPGLWHHVMNRGARKQPLFADDEDRKAFLRLVEDCNKRFGVQTHALVLMPNHYHLLVLDVSARLGRSMRHLDGVHTQAFNRRHGLDGPLFRGRYKSRLVGGEKYLLEVFRYIHYNPVKHGFVTRAGDWAWSSHRFYLSGDAPSWLVMDEFFERFGGTAPEARRRIDEFVHERGQEFLKGVEVSGKWNPLLGDEAFLKLWRERLKGTPTASDREIPDGRQLTETTPDEVVAATSAILGVPETEIRNGTRGATNLARRVALVICAWETAATRRQIAEALGMAPGSVSVLAKRYRDALDEGGDGRRRLEAVRKRLAARS